ncbi:unnamed protein product [Caenorhabditis nigoni]
MKFLKFPTLIQLEILQFLDPFEYFILSLCSRKTKKCLKKLKYKNAEIWIYEDGYFFGISLRRNKSCSLLFYAYVKSHENLGNWKTKIEYDGQQAEYSWKTLQMNQSVMDVATKKCARIIHKYICDLFNAPLNDICFHEISNIRPFCHIFGYNIKRSIFRDFGRITWHDLEEFYTRFPDHEYSEIQDKVKMDKLTYYTDKMWKDQKIMETKNLVIWHTDDQSEHFLYHFKGEHGLFMSCDYLSSYDFKKFLKSWMNGENENLKSICCFPKSEFYVSNEVEIFEGFRIRKDSVQRKFDYGPLIEKYDHQLPRTDFLNGIMIGRTSDGKLATVFSSQLYFAFFLSD